MIYWDALGFLSVSVSLICYAFESRSPVLCSILFGVACGLGSVYGFAKEAWPFGVVEIFWTLMAFKKARDFHLKLKSSGPFEIARPTSDGISVRTSNEDDYQSLSKDVAGF